MDVDGPLELRDVTNVTLHQRIIHELNLAPIESVPHKYCFVTGRHGEFLYLKLGAACKTEACKKLLLTKFIDIRFLWICRVCIWSTYPFCTSN